MRRLSSLVAVPLLLIGCAQLGGPNGAGGKGTGATGEIARPDRPDTLCPAISGAIKELDGYLGRLGQLNLCLGMSPCPSEENAKKACEARDALAGFHTSDGCTDAMVGRRPSLCDRL
jgi:hypothetical protein